VRKRPANLIDCERHFCDAQLRDSSSPSRLEPLGTVTTAGRECIRLRATERPDSLFWSHWLSFGGEEYEFHADPRRGALLAILAFTGGEVCETQVVQEVAFDEPLDESLFTYEPRRGNRSASRSGLSSTSPCGGDRAGDVHGSGSTDPAFANSPCDVMWHSSHHGGSAPHLYVSYRHGESLSLNQSEAAIEWDTIEWDAVTRNGRKIEIFGPR